MLCRLIGTGSGRWINKFSNENCWEPEKDRFQLDEMYLKPKMYRNATLKLATYINEKKKHAGHLF
jgi:hypothetical protein